MMWISFRTKNVLTVVLIAMTASTGQAFAQGGVCAKEKLDAMFARLDVADARQKGVEPSDPSSAFNAANACLNAHGLPADPSFSVSANPGPTLTMRYARAIQSAVQASWNRPKDLPQLACRMQITQLPGGELINAVVDSDCPYDEAGRKSVLAAVMKAQPLPYKGFESVFRRTLMFTFIPGPAPLDNTFTGSR